MSIESIFGTDEALERDGVWINFGEGAGKFLIAAAAPTNLKFARVAERLLKPYRRQIEVGALGNDVARKVSAQIYAEAIVLGWEGVTFKGEDFPYNRANAEELLTAMPRLMTALQKLAEDTATFQRAADEADAKN
jgi:hypothetical protein